MCLPCAPPSNGTVQGGGTMAKKDAASKRLAKEIALAEFLKKKPFFTLEELPPAPEELPALLRLGDPWPASLGSHASLGSDGRGASERPILDAFKNFGLDHRSLSDWYALVSHLAHVLFPTPSPRGPTRKWTDERLCKLLADVAAYKRKHPKASDVEICGRLHRKSYRDESSEALRRALQDARNPKRNSELARVVSILQHRLGPDVTVSWVIDRADALWGPRK
jgi:hypothetical protein